jgi:hypothetical protein
MLKEEDYSKVQSELSLREVVSVGDNDQKQSKQK